MDDLALLAELEEKSLLDELQTRYKKDVIYTYIGDILIAVNPYKTVNIYGSEKGVEYTDIGIRSKLPPHIYAISDCAYHNMLRNAASQCCVVSGESGAGKTESTKLMIQHIAQLCRHDSKDDLNDRIVKVNPLLEAFGNAQTVINNNSSRFGKYIELMFDRSGNLQGARISEYLLEKSRVVGQSAGERNFHIFYYLFAGLDEQRMKANLLNKPEEHRIIRPAAGGPVFTDQTELKYYKEMWNTLTEIMKDVGFNDEQTDGILSILAAVLHISDIEFQTDPETDGVFVKNEKILSLAAQLLAVSYTDLAESLISSVSSVGSGSETVTSLKTEAQANDGRDALAKALYGRLFSWIVYQVNMVLQNKNGASPATTIGILDIYGFENFRNNSFEQLCINVTNEQLQCFFNEHIFRWELEEYEREGISGNDVSYVDNKPLLDLFMEPMGLFNMLDDESKIPQGTDQTFADKITKSFAKMPDFRTPKGQSLEFTIQHFAGLVTYNVNGFLEKNRDTLSDSLTRCMRKADASLVYELFSPVSEFGQLEISKNMTIKRFNRKSRMFLQLPPDLSAKETSNDIQKRLSRMVQQNGRTTTMAPTASRTGTARMRGGGLGSISESGSGGSAKVLKTLGNQFKNSLNLLMNRLCEAQPHFIRCIKPNAEKASANFSREMVLQQLRYTGVLETVKIRKQGYPTRLTFIDFMQRYRYVGSTSVASAKPDANSCSQLLQAAGLQNWRIGHSKVFLRYYHVEQLNVALSGFAKRVATCQKFIRAFMVRRKYDALKRSAQEYREQLKQLQSLVDTICTDCSIRQTKLKVEDVEIKKAADEKARREEEDRKEQQRIEGLARTKNTKGTMMPGSRPDRAGIPSRLITPPEDEEVLCFNKCNCLWKSFHDELERGSKPVNSGTADTVMTLLADTLPKVRTIPIGLWSKVYLMEKNAIVGKFYLRDKEVEINDSTATYNGAFCGLLNEQFRHLLEDPEVSQTILHIGRGIKLSCDTEGSIFMTRLTPCGVTVRVTPNTESCLSKDIIASKGVVGHNKIKVFDMSVFKRYIGESLRNQSATDPHSFNRLSTFSFSFGQNSDIDTDCPVWLFVVHFGALDLLGKTSSISEPLSQMSLKPADDIAVRKNWQHLNYKRGQSSTLTSP